MQSQILVVEDQVMVQDALCLYMDTCDDFHPVGCESKADALALIAENGAYDLVLLDLQLPDATTVTDHLDVITANAGKPVALLSGSARKEDVSVALKIGMKGYLSKKMRASDFLDAVHQLVNGQNYFVEDTEVAVVTPKAEQLLKILSKMEQQVLTLMKLGMSNVQISVELNVRQNHVARCVTTIYRKIGVRTRLQAVTLMHF